MKIIDNLIDDKSLKNLSDTLPREGTELLDAYESVYLSPSNTLQDTLLLPIPSSESKIHEKNFCLKAIQFKFPSK